MLDFNSAQKVGSRSTSHFEFTLVVRTLSNYSMARSASFGSLDPSGLFITSEQYEFLRYTSCIIEEMIDEVVIQYPHSYSTIIHLI